MYGDDRSSDLRSSLPDASVAERRPVEAKARSRKAKHDEREQDLQRALAGPVPRPDEHRALADVTVTNARHRGQSAPLPTGGYVPVDVNHASLSAPVGVSIGAAGTAGGAVAHDGASPSPLQADDPVELRDDRGRNRCRIRDCVAALRGAEQRTGHGFARNGTDDRHDRQGGLRAGQHGDLHRGQASIPEARSHSRSPTWPATPASTALPMSMRRLVSRMAARAMPTASPTAPSLLNGKSPPMAAPPAPCCSLRPSPAARPPPRRSATRPTRSCSRTKSLAIRRANGASSARAARTSRASPPTSAPIVARPSTSRSTRIPTTIASTSIGSAITAAWELARSTRSSIPASRASPRRCATAPPVWSTPATGRFRPPGQSGRCSLGHLHRQARAPGWDRRREPDPVHRAR